MNTNMFKTILRAPGHHDHQVLHLQFNKLLVLGGFRGRTPDCMSFRTPFSRFSTIMFILCNHPNGAHSQIIAVAVVSLD